MRWLNNKETEDVVYGKPMAELLPPRTVTCIQLNNETELWEVWYKNVRFAELEELKEAHDRLQKLLALDSTK